MNQYSAQSPSRYASPINYKQIYASTTPTPPREQTVKKDSNLFVSPARSNYSEDNQQSVLWRSRCQDLEHSRQQLQVELDYHKVKAQKADHLEGKVDSALKHNVQLLGEKDNLTKQYSQKKTEADIWRTKYEQQMNQVISIKANQELEIKKLTTDLNRLKEAKDLAEIEKVREVADTKNKHQTEHYSKIESLKNSHTNNIALFEEQNRKMRESVQEKESFKNEKQNTYQALKNDHQSNVAKAKSEKEQLKSQILASSLRGQQDSETQKIKLEKKHQETIQNYTNLHNNKTNVLNDEIENLKHLLEIKNQEIQTLIEQNKSQKNSYDNSANGHRTEIKHLKETIQINNNEKDEHINELQEKLAQIHSSDIHSLKCHHDNQLNALSNENDKLKQIISSKTEEIDAQYREKMQQRESFNIETSNNQSQIDSLKSRHAIAETDKEQQINQAAINLDKEVKNHNEFSAQQKVQIDFLEQEIQKLKDHLVAKGSEIDQNQSQHYQVKKALEEDVKELRYQIEEIRKQHETLEIQKNIAIEDLKHQKQVKEQQLLEQHKQIIKHTEATEFDKKTLNEALLAKCHENDNFQKSLHASKMENQKKQQEYEEIHASNIIKEQQKIQETEQLKIKLESSSQFQHSNIKKSHENHISVYNQEISDLKTQLELKDQQIRDMVIKYDKLEKALLNQQQQQNNGSYDMKMSNIGSQILSGEKNIYDVYSKTRKSSANKKVIN